MELGMIGDRTAMRVDRSQRVVGTNLRGRAARHTPMQQPDPAFTQCGNARHESAANSAAARFGPGGISKAVLSKG